METKSKHKDKKTKSKSEGEQRQKKHKKQHKTHMKSASLLLMVIVYKLPPEEQALRDHPGKALGSLIQTLVVKFSINKMLQSQKHPRQ